MTDLRFSAEDVVRLARDWLGTPYQHQASCRGAGTDCLGLILGVWRELYGTEPSGLPAYTPDWSETTGEESVLDAAGRHLEPVAGSAPEAGQVVVFRMRPGFVAKHMGVVAGNASALTFIHAYSGRAVVETRLGPFWATRIAGLFRFPSVPSV